MFFFWLLEVSIVNSYLLYTMVQKGANKNPIAHKIYRKRLVESLVDESMAFWKQATPSEGAVFRGPKSERLNGIPHFMDRRDRDLEPFPVLCGGQKTRGSAQYTIVKHVPQNLICTLTSVFKFTTQKNISKHL